MASIEPRPTIVLEGGNTWQLCTRIFLYCAVHGKCPAILDVALPNGIEIVKQVGVSSLFFCKKCGMVKMVNVWNNTSGLCSAKLEG